MPQAKLRLMVASTVYDFEDQLSAVIATLSGYGYDVWNSSRGTLPVHPSKSNLENCVCAARDCDLFLGILRPSYGSGKVGSRSITHEECLEAVHCVKPRWFLVHRNVTLARSLLKPYMFDRKGKRTSFKLRNNPVIDDLQVIDLYNDVIQNDVPVADRRGHWAQEFGSLSDVLGYLETQFKDIDRVRGYCEEMKRP